MKNDRIKKGDLVKGIINYCGTNITIEPLLKVWSKLPSYGGIIVEIPDEFRSPYIIPWKGKCQSEFFMREGNLSPDKFYYYFDSWIVIRNKKGKMKI